MKTMQVAKKIAADKGDEWAEKCAGNLSGSEAVAQLVYQHFLESDAGKKAWDSPENEEKVDDIFDSIHDNYVHDLEWMTEEEWQQISDDLYSMVYEGVF